MSTACCSSDAPPAVRRRGGRHKRVSTAAFYSYLSIYPMNATSRDYATTTHSAQQTALSAHSAHAWWLHNQRGRAASARLSIYSCDIATHSAQQHNAQRTATLTLRWTSVSKQEAAEIEIGAQRTGCILCSCVISYRNFLGEVGGRARAFVHSHSRPRPRIQPITITSRIAHSHEPCSNAGANQPRCWLLLAACRGCCVRRRGR